MRLPRRGFIKSGTLSAVSAVVAIGGASSVFGQKGKRIAPGKEEMGPVIAIKAQRDPLFHFTRGTFEPYVGGIFAAPNALGMTVELKLVSVTAYEVKTTTRISTRKSRELDSFSLTFTSRDPLPQFTSIHKISHPALGKFDLFLTSTKQEDGTFTYEAVFNHL